MFAVLSTVSLALLIISNLAELNKIMQTLGQDGLFPRVCKRHHLFVSVVISIWSGLVLRAGQLVMMMSSGPVLMNVLICFCTIVFRYRKVETRKPAVFSYNLIVGELVAVEGRINDRGSSSPHSIRSDA